MTRLIDACEPLLQYVCRLNRSARKGAAPDMSVVKGELRALLEETRARASADPRLSAQYEKIELPLIYFADFMIKESDLPFARQWRELAHERNKLAGDEEFFDLLDETLKEQGADASDRLEVFYTCIGLGFTGFYMGQPEYLRKKMMEVSVRLRDRLDASQAAKICPEAYEHTDTSDLIEPPGRSLVGVGIALAGLVGVLFVVNAYMYRLSSSDLLAALRDIQRQAGTVTAGAAGGQP